MQNMKIVVEIISCNYLKTIIYKLYNNVENVRAIS